MNELFGLGFDPEEMEKFGEIEPAFSIDSDDKAEWAIRRISEIRAESERLIAVSEHYIEFYRNKITDAQARCTERCDGLIAMLRSYFDSVPHKVTRTQQTYALPSGKLTLKIQQPKIERDDAALTDWLRENRPEFIEVKETPRWGDFKKTVRLTGTDYVTEDGEIVPGITVTPRDPVFTVDAK